MALPTYTPEPEEFDSLNAAMQYMAVKVRIFLRDYEEKNHLNLGLLENEWEDIYAGLEDAITDYNVTQPTSSYDIQTFPLQFRQILYYRAAAHCLRSEATHQARNYNQYSDQGFSISEYDKMPLYLQLAQTFEQMYEDKKLKYKAQANAEATWGGLWSEAEFLPGGGRSMDQDVL